MSDDDLFRWYNGWSWSERQAATPIQKAAIRDGLIARPATCAICGFTPEGWSSNPVWLHNENYDQPLDVHHVCRNCHVTLHERFEQPERWLALVALYATGSNWFERLTMDPESRWRPFEKTYPMAPSPEPLPPSMAPKSIEPPLNRSIQAMPAAEAGSEP